MSKKTKAAEKISADDLQMLQGVHAQVNGAAQALQAAQAAKQFVEGTLMSKYKIARHSTVDLTTGEIKAPE